MELTATPRRIPSHQADIRVLPEEVLAREILVRLPAKALILCRAVCRSWRHLTSDLDFLRAHHSRQPSLPLLSFHSQANNVDDAALDLSRSPVERRLVLRVNNYNFCRRYWVWASCDGLLLLSLSNGRFYICNPTTRQWLTLPTLTGGHVFGMYLHIASGEYRILYKTGNYYNSNNSYVLTVGSAMEPRSIGVAGLRFGMQLPPVLLRGCLYWLHHGQAEVLAFDTAVESFKSIRAPPIDGNQVLPHLLEMDGTLGISTLNESTAMMKLWVLQDYETEVWLLKYQIEFPVVEMRSIIATNCSFSGMILSKNGDVLAYSVGNGHLFHIDSRGKLLQEFHGDPLFSMPIGHWFKESLVKHAFFQRQTGARGRAKLPRFFGGL